MTTPTILHIAIATPLRRIFDYLLPANLATANLQPGIRVEVPFGRQKMIGLLLQVDQHTTLPYEKLKFITRILDQQPIISSQLLYLCQWASDYYHYPIGEVISAALPILLRQGEKAQISGEIYYRLTEKAKHIAVNQFKRAIKQAAFFNILQQYPEGVNHAQLKQYGITSATLTALKKKNLIERIENINLPIRAVNSLPLSLNTEQQQAVNEVVKKLTQFASFLLYGVTGSGKTEVYLQIIEQVLKRDRQALIIVPEIGLTPQTVLRFQNRFPVPVVALHSALSDRERLNAWLMAANGVAKIVIGTRSAIFTPLKNLGIIIIDEEHDLSLKQQDGFRYSARDLAVICAKNADIPILMGSATPSLESLFNIENKRYQLLILSDRAGNAIHPEYHVVDIRNQKLQEGLSTVLLQAIDKHLQQNNQVLIFLNRRGFAPVLMCHTCGWIANCSRCDTKLVLHRQQNYLCCHQCGVMRRIYTKCPNCEANELISLGVGTQRLEAALKQYFPEVPVTRIDRDSMRGKKTLTNTLESILKGGKQILIGTQMLAKGHHFPDVTLVAIIDADHGFFSADFRAMERMGQLLLQVAGRAGRAEKPGEVYIQTHHPTHPLLQTLLKENYLIFAKALLYERELINLPPYSYLALLRAEAADENKPIIFLQEVKKIALQIVKKELIVQGPVSAPMLRRAGHYRSQLLLLANQRQILQKTVKSIVTEIEKLKITKQVRWSVDIDPQEIY